MHWHYNCPDCGAAMAVDWDRLARETKCSHCGRRHYPPTPAEDHYGYVDDRHYPRDMEEVVFALRGSSCVVPNCFEDAAVLVHKRPFSQGGRTSVDNLIPMCRRHAQLKGEHDYQEWLDKLTAANAQSKPVIEVTITAKEPKPDRPVVAAPAPPKAPVVLVPIAAGRGLEVESEAVPEAGATLWLAMPFLRGPIRRLVLDYDWQTLGSGNVRIWLAAWPAGTEPDCGDLSDGTFTAPAAGTAYAGEGRGRDRIELVLPDAPEGRWTAAIVVDDQGGGLVLGDYCIAGLG